MSETDFVAGHCAAGNAIIRDTLPETVNAVEAYEAATAVTGLVGSCAAPPLPASFSATASKMADTLAAVLADVSIKSIEFLHLGTAIHYVSCSLHALRCLHVVCY